MANTSAVYARIDTELKENAEGILSQLGISPSSAIQMLYSQIVLKKGMPFELRLPSTKPAAVGGMSREQLERSLTGPVTELLLSVLMETDAPDRLSEDEMLFIASFYSYAFIGIMLDWIGNGMGEKPDVMIKRIEAVMAGSFEKAVERFASLHSIRDARIPDKGVKL